MKKFSIKELTYLANDSDLLYPDNHMELRESKEKYLRSIGATDKDIEEGDDLCPEEFWWHANDLVIELAQALLDELEKKYDNLIDPIEDIERELKQLKKIVESNFKSVI